MKHLILFDLHYQHANSLSRKKLDRIEEIEGDFDSLILGGDNAELTFGLQNHHILFDRLKRRFTCPTGFVVGNHELWGKLFNISSWRLFNETFPTLGKEYGFVYLEKSNLDVQNFSFVGTYGHFDYSFLRQGVGVTIEDLLKGTIIAEGKRLTWNDVKYMDWEGMRDEEVCTKIVKSFGERIESSSGKIISVSHTIPSLALNGWPDSLEQFFLESYSGSNLIGNILETYGGEYHFCGHTHIKARNIIKNTDCINLGSDYNLLRYVILQTGEESKVEEREIVIT